METDDAGAVAADWSGSGESIEYFQIHDDGVSVDVMGRCG
jgi:hypothetical protein